MRREFVYVGFAHAFVAQLGFGLGQGLAEHQRLALRQAVGVQPLVVVGHRVEADDRHDEVRRNQLGALVQQLVVGVLTVAADTAPDHRPGVGGHGLAVLAHAFAVGFHVQLLQVLGDVTQVVIVRQDRVALRAPEVAVPHAEQGQQHRHVLFERCALEVLVHGVGTGQQFLEVGHADGQGNRQADGRPQRVAATDPVPHREDVFFADTEGYGGGVVARYRDEMAIQLGFRTPLGQIPGTGGLGVFQGFEGVEGFRRDDEQRGLGAQLHGQFVELAAVDVRQVMATHAFLGVGQQGFGHQLRAEEGAADADVHHVSDRLLGVTAPQTVVDTADEVGDLVQYLVHFRHHVDAIDRQLVADRAAQGRVQGRTTFGRVDDFAIEQRLDRALEVDFVGQAHQQIAGLGVDQVLRIVEKQAAAAEGELSKALRIGIEGFAHAEILHGLAVVIQRLPGGQSGNVVRSAVIRHRCGFPFYLNGLLNTKNPGAQWMGVPVNCVDTISWRRANTVNPAQ
ncbi:hypothetical protein D3C72_796790 [compost metagenome]